MIISQTPLRISFAGGGTDLASYSDAREGFVVSSAIDKFVYVVVKTRYDDKIYVSWRNKEIVDRVDEIKHELVREAMRIAGVENGIEIAMMADIPSEGSGLGSSSSVTVGLLNALHVLQGDQVGPRQLAEEACRIEIDILGKPIGRQDQFAASFGGVNAFTFARDGTTGVERLRMSGQDLRHLASSLFLFYSNTTRQASSVLMEQNARTSSGTNLGELDGIKVLGHKARDAIVARDFDRIGDILDENWRLKKSLAAGVTNGHLDEMHQRAMKAGATGAKVCGAGGGGFLMVYCPPSHHKGLHAAMAEYRQMPFLLEPDGSKIILDYRRGSWK